MKVTVILETFNHEQFIAQALRGVLAQETSFPFEIIISEDCSSDQTLRIVREFHEAQPNQIRLIVSERNLNSNEVLVRAIAASRGEYIALLDGDDYWTCSTKLQRQVEYLDTHSECVICHHNMEILCQDGMVADFCNASAEPELSDLRDLLRRGNFIYFGSVMFRNLNTLKFPEWFNTIYCGDFALHVLNSQRGQIGYLSYTMGVYRLHSGGAWSGLDRHSKLHELIRFYGTIRRCLGFRDQILARRVESSLWYQLGRNHCELGELRPAFRCLPKTLFDPQSSAKLLLVFLVGPKVFYFLRSQLHRFYYSVPGVPD